MTADDLADFLTSVRAEAAARLARLDTVDTALLPHGLRAEYEQMRSRWLDLLAMTEDDVIELHLAACEHAGRELTPAEARALIRRQ